MEMRSNLPRPRQQIGCGKEVMRSTRIRLAAIAALAPSRHRDDGRPSSVPLAALLAIVAGCNRRRQRGQERFASNLPKTSSRGPEAGSRSETARDRGRRPGKPERHPRARALAGRRPHRMVVRWDQAPPSIPTEEAVFRCRVCSSFTRTAPGPRLCARIPSPSQGQARRARFSNSRNVGSLLARWDRGRLCLRWQQPRPVHHRRRRREASPARPVPEPRSRSRGWREFCGEPLEEAAAWSPDGSQDRVVRLRRRQRHVRPPRICPLLRQPGRHRPAKRSPPCPAVVRPASSGRPTARGLPSGRRGPDIRSSSSTPTDRACDRSPATATTAGPRGPPDGSRIAFVHNGTLSTIAPDGTDMQSVNGRDTGRSDRLEPGRITGRGTPSRCPAS